MSIVAWMCPYCEQRVDLDHFAVSEACGLKLHPAYAAAVLAAEAADPHGSAMSVTDGLSCPRHAAIKYQEAICVNPLDYNALLIGSVWDAVVSLDNGIPNPNAGRSLLTKVKLSGEIAGMKITGELDNVRRLGSHLILSDWKHSNNLRAYWIYNDGGPSMEYKVQTSIYAELYRQMYDEAPTLGEVVYHFSGAGGAFHGELKKFQSPALLPYQYDIVPLAECLAYKPYSGSYSVEDLYRMAQPIYTEKRSWKDLPLAGESMAFGNKSYCDYCEVRSLCFEQSKGAPF